MQLGRRRRRRRRKAPCLQRAQSAARPLWQICAQSLSGKTVRIYLSGRRGRREKGRGTWGQARSGAGEGQPKQARCRGVRARPLVILEIRITKMRPSKQWISASTQSNAHAKNLRIY
eukprot:1138199-Pelagomonas_calceolata.AAC.5